MKLFRLNHWLKYMVLMTPATLLLTGCFGGTLAQQLARSLFIHGADKATAAAVDAHERNKKIAPKFQGPINTELNDYQIIFSRSGFEYIHPQIEALPQAYEANETTDQMIRVSKLINVEVWNLILGDEKQHHLEKASVQGSPLIPPREEWSRWHVAVGSAENNDSGIEQTITFLIPPEIGKMRSGARALVEMPSNGELSIARYALN